MILRSARRLGATRCKGEWIAMYNLDRASDQQRAKFLERVRIHFAKSLVRGITVGSHQPTQATRS